MLHILERASCVALMVLFPFNTSAQVAQTGSHEDLFQKVTIAMVSAILSLFGGYLLLLLKERREPKRRLSYDLEVRRGLLGIEESIARFVELTYKGNAASNVAYVRCDVRNTGNTVIKDQYLRFDFEAGSSVLDSYTDPLPPKEFGVEEAPEAEPQAHEKRFRI